MKLGYMAWVRYPDFGIQVGRTLEELIKEIAPIGYDSLEITAWRSQEAFPAYMSEEKRKRVRKIAEDLGMKIVCIDGAGGCPFYFSEYGYLIEDTVDRAGIIHFMEKCIDLACDLGADKILDLSGRKPEEMSEKRAWELLSTSVGDMCDYASERGVFYLMEMEEEYLVHDTDTFLRLAKEVDSKAFKVNFDYSNLLIDGASDREAQKAVNTLSKYIVNAHVKGLRRAPMIGPYTPTVPGSKEDVQDLRGFFSALKKIGYDGSINVEDLPEWQQPPRDKLDSAELSYDNIARIMEEVGVRKRK